MEPKYILVKNLLVLSGSFLLNYIAYTSISFLQSSINPYIGTNSLSLYYVGIVISSITLTTWLISKLGAQRTIGFTMLCYSTYIAAQFYPRSYTLFPTALFLGAGSAAMTIAMSTYVTKIAFHYALVVGQKSEVIVTRFFGVFFVIYNSAGIIGNIISSTVLSLDVDHVLPNDTKRLQYCGKNYCNEHSNNTVILDRGVADFERYIMITVYLCFTLMGSFIAITFLDPLEKNLKLPRKTIEDSCNESEESQVSTDTKAAILAIFVQMKNKYQILLIPLTLWSGVEQAFMTSDFTASYVACGLGVHMIGYTMICFGVFDVFWSMAFGPIVKLIGRPPVFLLGALMNTLHIIALLYWSPNPSQPWPFFFFTGTWGMTNAIWQTQTNALIGILFPDASAAAFSNHRLWKAIGCVIAFNLSEQVCTNVKIYSLCAFLSLAMAGYLTVELMEIRKKKRNGKEP